MFHAVPAHLQTRMHPTHAAAASPPPPLPQQQHGYLTVNNATTTTDAAMFHGFPVTTSDGRSVVYLMPSTATTTTVAAAPQAVSLPPSFPQSAVAGTPPQPWPSLSAAAGRPDRLTPTWAAATAFPMCGTPPQPSSSSVAMEGPPPYADGACATVASSFSTSSLLRPSAASANGMSTTTAPTTFDASTASNVSGAALLLPFLATAPPPPQQPPATPTHPLTCYWVDSTTGAVTAMPAEATAPPPPTPSTTFGVPANSVFSASLSGAVPFLPIVAMAPPPPPPPAPKAMNGLQYEHGELYEGFVKRYNPNRGFGFLTATYHITPDDSTGSPAASLTSPPAAAATKERRIPVHLGDIFVHQSYMHMQGFRTLPVGGRVRFRVGYKDGQQTFQAVDVELLPQVVPQSMESSTASPNAATAAPHLTMTAKEFERVIGPVGSPVGWNSHAEAERFFFAAPKDTTRSRSPVTATQGISVDGEDEDDSPLIELAYEVYTSLEE